ncbi:class I SAM-dependent methyltransferase [Streptomyces sp. BPPL-273]|uniref:class I SAM-dependent methyltransferase n=1 Tax=Streptomyces sp. BPPL-273 TaxID=2987533 RepID=UPI0024AF8C31|nr:class I SAM-dependent methyltransferase [Streptomyces sp. BPPL-273]WHM35067.1 class I SAM-dependent methyltransferase [Streptomyces sp. BPPL-273]
MHAEGFDPHHDFGWPRLERTGFDLVTSMFVLNVLPDPWQRIQALKDAASFARPGGHVVVVTRSPEVITSRRGRRLDGPPRRLLMRQHN